MNKLKHYKTNLCISVDGDWNSWMTWTTCSVSCGHGYHVRSRLCDNPEPVGNGTNCTGTDFDTKPCFMPHCPGEHSVSSFLFS